MWHGVADKESTQTQEHTAAACWDGQVGFDTAVEDDDASNEVRAGAGYGFDDESGPRVSDEGGW